MTSHRAFLSLAFVALTACTAGEALQGDGGALRDPSAVQSRQQLPSDAPPGTCWGKSVRPAVVESVTEQILVEPAELDTDGNVLRPAIYRTETQQQIVAERQDTWFETPCPDVLTEDFIASVQRALQARAIYQGHITGIMDARTRAAIRRYQEPQGLDSGILALETARQFGLIAVQRSS